MERLFRRHDPPAQAISEMAQSERERRKCVPVLVIGWHEFEINPQVLLTGLCCDLRDPLELRTKVEKTASRVETVSICPK